MFWLVFPLLALVDNKISLKAAYLFGLVMWPVTAAFFAVGLKHRWGERPDAEDRPFGVFRPLSRASDRFLFWFQWLGVAGIAGSVAPFIRDTVPP